MASDGDEEMEVTNVHTSPYASHATTVPLELILHIFKLAVASESPNSRSCALAISRVSQFARQEVLAYIFSTIIISSKGTGHVVGDASPIPHPHLVRNLWLDPCYEDEGDAENLRTSYIGDVLKQPFLTNITHLALPTVAQLSCLVDARDQTRTHVSFSNLSQCHSLTLFRVKQIEDVKTLSPTMKFISDNITHLQIYPSGRQAVRSHKLVNECLMEFLCLTHLAIFVRDGGKYFEESTSCFATLQMMRGRRVQRGGVPIVALVLAFDWKALQGRLVERLMFSHVASTVALVNRGVVSLVTWGRDESDADDWIWGGDGSPAEEEDGDGDGEDDRREESGIRGEDCLRPRGREL